MHRFFLPPDQCHGPELILNDSEAHHALRVLRVRPGDRAVVLDGDGSEFLCSITSAGRNSVHLQVKQKTANPPLSHRLTLIQAIPKGKAMDLIVQKATELGVSRVVPILSERTIAHLEEELGSAKIEKWQATAIEAIKQCGSAWLPRFDPPLSPQEFLSKSEPFDISMIATLQSAARHPREFVDAYRQDRRAAPQSIAVWIGPEGDFTPSEINLIRSHGALPITLGPLVLRSETAALYSLAILNYELNSPART